MKMDYETADKPLPNGNVNSTVVELSEAENELYDRQIRLWGLESQKRLRTSKVLIYGINGLGAEVTKNIILAGVNSVVLQDNKVVTEEDFCSQFLAPRTALGQNRAESSIERAKALNPMVEISGDTASLQQKEADFFKAFDVVVICGATNAEILRVDQICRTNQIKFFAGDVWGTFGYYFADLLEHTFLDEVFQHKVISAPKEKTKSELVATSVERTLVFPSYADVLADYAANKLDYKKLNRTGPAILLLRTLQKFREQNQRDPYYKTRSEDIDKLRLIFKELFEDEDLLNQDYYETVFAQIAPACAVVGGVLAQDVIKVVTKKEAPHCNVFLFDPEISCGFVETFGKS